IVKPYTDSDTVLERHYRAASVVVVPSRAEPYGLVGPEALSHGAPLILSSESGFAELLRSFCSATYLELGMSIYDGNGSTEQLSPRRANAVMEHFFDEERSVARSLRLRDRWRARCPWQAGENALLTRLDADYGKKQDPGGTRTSTTADVLARRGD